MCVYIILENCLYKKLLYSIHCDLLQTVGVTHPESSNKQLSQLVDDQHRGGKSQQVEQVPASEGFCLEDSLQWSKVDDQELANERAPDSIEEHPIGQEPD